VGGKEVFVTMKKILATNKLIVQLEIAPSHYGKVSQYVIETSVLVVNDMVAIQIIIAMHAQYPCSK